MCDLDIGQREHNENELDIFRTLGRETVGYMRSGGGSSRTSHMNLSQGCVTIYWYCNILQCFLAIFYWEFSLYCNEYCKKCMKYRTYWV